MNHCLNLPTGTVQRMILDRTYCLKREIATNFLEQLRTPCLKELYVTLGCIDITPLPEDREYLIAHITSKNNGR